MRVRRREIKEKGKSLGVSNPDDNERY